ncbi:MAG: winged helix-turn-helix transcriptional regulator [Candidatus Bathyarchaeota archaeon]|nr:winged helix-turn-helix transcriptional regulator [Candidatus Bathyarchaeota archaeon]MDH5494653.1 winged helix-turn-helix transcriptional regulator [Candidatus Bathyarchaeota archaeon]
MKLNRALFVFLLATVIVSSFSAIVYAHRNKPFSVTFGIDQHNLLVISIPFVLTVEHNDRLPPLNQSTRTYICSFIKNNPGIHFRGICNSLNISIGVAQYHLGLLTKAGLLSIFRDGRYKRYFKSNRFTKREMTIISLLRHQTAKGILSILLERKYVSHNELASELSISSQALTWQISRLERAGIIQRAKDKMKTAYFLNEAKALAMRRCINFLDARAYKK